MTRAPTGLSARSQQQWEAYLTAQIQAGVNGRDTLVAELAAGGYTPADAQAMVSRAFRTRQNKLGGTLGCGVLLTLAGLTTLFVPLQSQGRAWLWIGAILCGLIGIVYSIVQLAKTR